MISQNLQDALNKQIAEDHRSSRLYLSMAAHCEGVTLHGFSKRFRKQGNETLERAEKIVKYMTRHGGHVELAAVEAPKATWDSALTLAEDARERERHVSDHIGRLVDQAFSEGDNATGCFLQGFVSKQAEKESSAARLAEQLRLLNDSPAGVFLLDRSVG
jgi:ferritin